MSDASGERGAALLAKLSKRWEAVEVYEKRGRSRRFSRGPEGENVVYSVEAGWAVRAGDGGASCFRAGSGEPPRALELPPAVPPALRLPEPRTRPAGPEPRGLEAALASEAEGMSLLSGVARELERELPGARLETGRLEDGASEARIRSSRGVDVAMRARSASLRLEAAWAEQHVSAELIARAASDLKPVAVARRVADRLLALAGGAALPDAGARLLLAPPVAARLVEALAPWLVGAGAEQRLAQRLGAELELGSPKVTLIDDGGHPDGVLASPWDGEGVPTAAVRLVEEGVLVAPLRAWWEADDAARASGCSRRAGWREQPRRGPTQLLLAPDPGIQAATLIEQGESGAYLVAPEGGLRVDGEGRFRLPVCGFALVGGRAAGALGRCWLRGDLLRWMRGIDACARDLSFVPGDGLYGAPTLRVAGLTLEPAGQERAARRRRGSADGDA